MLVYYECENEVPAVMPLDELLGNFIRNDVNPSVVVDVKTCLEDHFPYHGRHVNGRFMVIAFDKIDAAIDRRAEMLEGQTDDLIDAIKVELFDNNYHTDLDRIRQAAEIIMRDYPHEDIGAWADMAANTIMRNEL